MLLFVELLPLLHLHGASYCMANSKVSSPRDGAQRSESRAVYDLTFPRRCIQYQKAWSVLCPR